MIFSKNKSHHHSKEVYGVVLPCQRETPEVRHFITSCHKIRILSLSLRGDSLFFHSHCARIGWLNKIFTVKISGTPQDMRVAIMSFQPWTSMELGVKIKHVHDVWKKGRCCFVCTKRKQSFFYWSFHSASCDHCATTSKRDAVYR